MAIPVTCPSCHASYALADNFQTVAKHITDSGKMIFDVLGDSGGVKDAEFQSSVANEMIKGIGSAGANSPHFCYHVGDVVYFTGAHDGLGKIRSGESGSASNWAM